MRGINLFYITVLLLGIGLFFFLGKEDNSSPLSFYGFAESNETEINYNYPVVVEKILVSPGQEVQKGDTILNLTRRKSKETLDDYSFKINKLRAESAQWSSEKENDRIVLRQEKEAALLELRLEIEALEKEIAFKKTLSTGLNNISTSQTNYTPQEQDVTEKKSEYRQSELLYDLKINALNEEIDRGLNPYLQEINQIKAEQSFDETQKVIPISVLAPGNGLIGNVSCKEDEHIPSYSTLMTFYEPHSGYIRGFVHEDLTLQVSKGNRFKVYSLKNPEINYEGVVTGLGSRIIEIPTRLRKIAEFKTYGREVIVSITKENSFLQKEKVGLTYIPSNVQ